MNSVPVEKLEELAKKIEIDSLIACHDERQRGYRAHALNTLISIRALIAEATEEPFVPEEETADFAWDAVLCAFRNIWPGDDLIYNESPVELIYRLRDELDSAKADDAAVLRKALEWYANPTRYVSNSVYMGGGQGPTSVDIDAGQRARAALGKDKEREA